jgi:hypothetical protein
MASTIYTKIDDVVPSLEGWCPVDKAKHMVDIILKLKNPICVELGVFAGRSLLPIAWACQAVGGQVTGVDPWSASASLDGVNAKENDEWWGKIDYDFFYNYTITLMKTHGVNDIVRLFRETSSHAVRSFEDKTIAFLHQDGNHSEEITVQEVRDWVPKIKSGGYWVFDDANWSTTRAAQELLETYGFTCIHTAGGNAWKIYKKKEE